ncbi:MAG: hypothetical protein PUC23_01495 [bacterium]|nr:hypothetical protein [bacterium]
MLNIIILSIIKIIDNILSTGKTILIQRNKAILAGISVIVSQVIFYKLIDAVADAESDLIMYIISIASGVGTYLAILIGNKFSKERLYVNILLSDDMDAMIELRNYLQEHKITNLTTDGYTKDFKKTLAITAYVETKEKSKLLDKYIDESNNKYKRIIQKV